MKKLFIVHPLFFALYPALLLFSRNINRVPLVYFFMMVAIIVLLAFLLWMLLAFILKNTEKAAIVASLLIAWFFFFGPVFLILRNQVVLLFFILRQRHLFPIWTLIFASAIFFVITKRLYSNNITRISNLISGSLIVFCLIDIGVQGISAKTMPHSYKARRYTTAKKTDNRSQNSPIRKVKGPDVYYIILDAYSSYDNLKKFYNFDNRDFCAYLTRKGFYIAQKSRSNYTRTTESLASALSMEYVHRGVSIDSSSEFPRVPLGGRQNRVLAIFRSMGYKYISVGDYNPYADLNMVYKSSKAQLFEYAFCKYLFEMTPLTNLAQLADFALGQSSYKESTLYCFEQLAKTSSIESPKFVFAHIYSPHPPFFVFGPNAEVFSLSKIFNLSASKMYVYQTIFINKKVEELIDTILSRSKNPPIIILQSDHGHFIEPPYQLDDQWLAGRFPILNAYYLPGDAKNLLYDSITPVNSFRVILNYYFNANLKLLEDEFWVSPYPYERRYDKFVDVTQRLKDIK